MRNGSVKQADRTASKSPSAASAKYEGIWRLFRPDLPKVVIVGRLAFNFVHVCRELQKSNILFKKPFLKGHISPAPAEGRR